MYTKQDYFQTVDSDFVFATHIMFTELYYRSLCLYGGLSGNADIWGRFHLSFSDDR